MLEKTNITGKINGGQLEIDGKYTSQELQKQIKQYSDMYVRCKNCESYHTDFRNNEIKCKMCQYKYNE